MGEQHDLFSWRSSSTFHSFGILQKLYSKIMYTWKYDALAFQGLGPSPGPGLDLIFKVLIVFLLDHNE